MSFLYPLSGGFAPEYSVSMLSGSFGTLSRMCLNVLSKFPPSPRATEKDFTA